MDTVLHFLSQQGVLLLFILVGIGMSFGHIKVKGVALGAAAVLFASIALSAFAKSRSQDLEVPEVFGTLGLTLFTFTVGVVSGPNFFASLRRGLGPILTTVCALTLGALVAVIVGRLLGLDPATIAGAFAGAVTNTPALAAAREAAHDNTLPTVAYAVTYIFGVIGMLLAAMLALRHRAQDTDLPPALVNCTVRVETTEEPRIRDIEKKHSDLIKFSRVRHGGMSYPIAAASDNDVLRRNDLVTVVGPADLVEQVTHELGHPSSHALDQDRSFVDVRRITLSNNALAGHPIGELDLLGKFGATISRVRRGDVDMLATESLVLQLGDRVRVIAPCEKMKAITAHFGDSARGMSDINPIALGIGMTLGILLGKIVFPVPGTVFSIGSAAGTLVLGLILGRLGRVGPFVTTMPFTAAQAISEFGLLIFLAQAGSKAGAQIGDAFASGAWIKIMIVGIAVTCTVAAGIYIAMRSAFHMGGTKLSGVLGGTQTQPAVLGFANGRTGHDSRVALGYALVYPAAMITKILLGQILGGL
jgi:putative transport protein